MKRNKNDRILTRKRSIVVKGKIGWEDEEIPVRLMAQADGYSMVRRKGCMPFVCSSKYLKQPTDPNNGYE